MLIKMESGGTAIPVKYLLKYDNPCEDITGGWTINNGNLSDAGITISNNGVNGYTAFTNHKIDLSPYSIILFCGRTTSHVYWGAECAITQNVPSASYDGQFAYPDAGFYEDGKFRWCSIDISDIDSGYVVLASGRAPSNIQTVYSRVILLKDVF